MYIHLMFAVALTRLLLALNPDLVGQADKEAWCTSQETSCTLLCPEPRGGAAQTQQNFCNPRTLEYECVCANGIPPNMSEYSQTIPYFICTESNNRCISRCRQDSNCANGCRKSCGSIDPMVYHIMLIKNATTTLTSSTTHSLASPTPQTPRLSPSGTGLGTLTPSPSASSTSPAARVASSNAGLSTDEKVAIGVGVGVGVPLGLVAISAIIAAYYLGRVRERMASDKTKSETKVEASPWVQSQETVQELEGEQVTTEMATKANVAEMPVIVIMPAELPGETSGDGIEQTSRS